MSLFAILLLAAMALANWLMPSNGSSLVAVWLITGLALVAILALLGRLISMRSHGVLIDNRNRVSLSKLQASAWTVVILAALITAASHNLHVSTITDPMAIVIPQNLLIAMSISATSLAATPALLSLKTNEKPEPDECQDAKVVGAVDSEGKVYGRATAAEAQWLDVFRGDEVSNAASPDISKIQQFLITAMLITIYSVLLGRYFFGLDGSAKILALPDFSDGFAWLMGISHGGYLAYKAAPHSRTTAAIISPAAATAAAAAVEEVG